jgi:hypothetical protein
MVDMFELVLAPMELNHSATWLMRDANWMGGFRNIFKTGPARFTDNSGVK